MLKQFSSLPNQGGLLWIAAAIAFAAPNLMLAQETLAPTNFNTQAIGTTSGTQTLTFTGLPNLVSVTAVSPTDFVANPSCASGTCTVAVTFSPARPGLRENAILVLNQQTGQVVGVGPVYGVGTGPQVAIGPGVISTVANRATLALASAVLNGVAIGPGGRVYVSDTTTNSVYYVDPTSGQVQVYDGTSGVLNAPSALAFDASANLFIADTTNNEIREVKAATGAVSIVAGTGSAGYNGDHIAATSAELNGPMGIVVDSAGNLYISDSGNNRVREVLASNGQIITLAGNGTAGYTGDNGAAASAELDQPVGIARDVNGFLYFADSNNSVIRKISTPVASGTITTVAGTGLTPGFSGDGGAATSAELSLPWSVAVDAGGSLYIADRGNQVIRKVTGDASHTISTIAGTHGVGGYSGDGGVATSATLHTPTYVALDGNANLYIVDQSNAAVREVTASGAPLTFPPTSPSSTSGPITLTVSNTGNTNLTLSGLTVTGYYYQSASTNSCSNSTSLAAGASCTIAVSFTPAVSNPPLGAAVAVTDNSLNLSSNNSYVWLYESAGLRFVPLTPCRVVDTRNNNAYSGTFLTGGSTRYYILQNNSNPPAASCPIPASAAAYSLNVTAIPHNTLRWLTVYPGPSGAALPSVSTLNSYDGRVKANAVIVPPDTSGGINVYVTDDSDVVLDIDGYFEGSGAANYSTDLAFYPVTPCRVADTREPAGSLGGPALTAGQTRDFPILSSACAANIPSNVAAYSLNITAIPPAPLGYLTAWPTGQTQPNASVLNAKTGAVTANAAIIPAGSSGDVSIYVKDASGVIIDINGYFAAPGTGGLALYPLTPCRALDTRNPSGSPPFSGTITAPILGTCSVQAGAEAYVVNVTAVPAAPLGYLTTWPNGAAQPNQSTLNAADQAVTSNLALIPTTNGSISAYASAPTHLILDIFGYFAP